MKHHDIKNKLLFERLTNQFSDGDIEEGFFKDQIDKVRNIGKNDALAAAEEKRAALDAEFPDDEQGEDMPAALKSQGEKLKAFGDQTLMLLNNAGISQEEKIYVDIVNALNTAVKSLEVSDAEAENAKEPDPRNWAEPPEDKL